MKRDKVKNLFDFLPKSKIKAGDGLEQGAYPFYTSSENQTKYLDEYIYEPGCLVFGTGGKASVHYATSRFATTTDCITIKSKPSVKIDAGYVFQYFKGNMQVLESGFKGAGLKHISKTYLSDIEIPHPEELDDQIRIAYLLSKVEWLIAQRKQHLHQQDGLLKSIFMEMFGDPVRNEKGWETSSIDGLCQDIIDCPHSTPTYSDEKTGYLCVRSGDIVNGYLVLSKTLQVDHSVYDERIKRHTPKVGDIVYSREGGRLGNAARILGKEKICLGQRIMLFKTDGENNSDFFWALLESVSFKSKLQGLVGGGAAPRVNIKDLKKIDVIKPPIDVQVKFSNIAQKIDQVKSHYQQSLLELENLYCALSQKAFKGELDLSRVPLSNGAALPASDNLKHDSLDQLKPKSDKLDIAKKTDTDQENFFNTWAFHKFLRARKEEVLTATDLWDALQRKNFKNPPPSFESFKNWILTCLEQGEWLEQVYGEVSAGKGGNLKEKKVALRIRDDS